MTNEFLVFEYSIGLTANGEQMMIVKLVKESEESQLQRGKLVGLAGTMELHIYDLHMQEYYKSRLGKKVSVVIG